MLIKGPASVDSLSLSLLDASFSSSDIFSPAYHEASLRLQLSRPDLLLKPDTGLNPLASIRTVHAATLFSGGAVIDGVINPEIRKEFALARSQGITALYVIGMWESTAFSALWTRHWAPTWSDYDSLKPDWVGASTFSTDSYFPNHLIGSWENLDLVLKTAEEEGISIIPCFVTNTIGMGGALMRSSLRQVPETIMRRDVNPDELEQFRDFISKSHPVRSYYMQREQGPSAGEHSLDLFHFRYGHDLYRYRFQGAGGEQHDSFLQICGKLYRHAWVIDRPGHHAPEEIHCIQLGSEDPFDRGDGSATVWSDTAHRSVHLRETRKQQIRELEPVLSRFPDIRCDMAHLAGIDAWQDYPALAREQGHGTRGMLLETYFDHDRLVRQDPAISVYANFLFNWLVREDMNIPAVMWHVHEQRELYQNHRLVAYVENHDDKGSTYLPVKGAQALIIASLPVESVLWGQNQRIGDSFRIAAQLHVPRDDFNQRQLSLIRGESGNVSSQGHLQYLEFFKKVEHLSALPIFRSPNSAWSKVALSSIDGRDQNRIYHIARELKHSDGTAPDRAVVIVDARREGAGTPLSINVAETFAIDARDLTDYLLVNLISGELLPPFEEVVIVPRRGDPEPHSYAFALVPKERAELAVVH